MDGVQLVVPKKGRTTTAALIGELDGPDARHVEAELLALAREPGVERLHLDLAELTFIDSGGLALLIKLERAAQYEGFSFAVVALSGQVRARLDRAGLLSLLVAEEGGHRGNRRRPEPEPGG